MSAYLLKLYITGNSTNSQGAIANLLKSCREELSNQYLLLRQARNEE